MIALLKSIVRRLIFRGLKPQKFYAVRLADSAVREQAFLVGGKEDLDITGRHCIVCHAPFFMAVFIQGKEADWLKNGKFSVQIRDWKQIVSEVRVSLDRTSKVGDAFVAIFEISKARCFQIGPLYQYFLMKRYFLYKKKDTLLQGKTYGALYSFPRKVIAVCYREEDYYNLFPMDFQCYVASADIYILGLRTTNITLQKMIRSGRVVIADTSSVDPDTIYFLGRNHSANPPAVTDLPFEVITSERFGFPVPAFSSSYREVQLIENFPLGTHMFMIGKVTNTVQLRASGASLHHIHFFQFATSDYRRIHSNEPAS
jgi:hypothetical protein